MSNPRPTPFSRAGGAVEISGRVPPEVRDLARTAAPVGVLLTAALLEAQAGNAGLRARIDHLEQLEAGDPVGGAVPSEQVLALYSHDGELLAFGVDAGQLIDWWRDHDTEIGGDDIDEAIADTGREAELRPPVVVALSGYGLPKLLRAWHRPDPGRSTPVTGARRVAMERAALALHPLEHPWSNP